jgi:hypothetical protein
MGNLVEAAEGSYLQLAIRERFAPGTVVHRPPIPGRDAHRPDRCEQVVGHRQASRGRERGGPSGIANPNPLSAERLKHLPPLSRRRQSRIGFVA